MSEKIYCCTCCEERCYAEEIKVRSDTLVPYGSYYCELPGWIETVSACCQREVTDCRGERCEWLEACEKKWKEENEDAD